MNENNLFSQASNLEIYSSKNYYSSYGKATLKKLKFLLPLIIFSIIFIISFVTHYFVNEEWYLKIDFDKAYISPCLKFPFGTNEFGQNQFYIIMSATYKTLLLAIIATIIDGIIGVIIGILWATKKRFNSVMFVIKNLFDNTPMFFFLIIISLILKEGFIPLLIVIVLFQWIEFAYITRNNLIIIKSKDYNKVSQLYNVPFRKIAINNYLPSLLPILFNNVALCIPKIINLEITVSYFGFYIGGKSNSLGTLIYTSITDNSYFMHPYTFIIPFTVLFVINLCIFFMGRTLSKTFTKEEQAC